MVAQRSVLAVGARNTHRAEFLTYQNVRNHRQEGELTCRMRGGDRDVLVQCALRAAGLSSRPAPPGYSTPSQPWARRPPSDEESTQSTCCTIRVQFERPSPSKERWGTSRRKWRGVAEATPCLGHRKYTHRSALLAKLCEVIESMGEAYLSESLDRRAACVMCRAGARTRRTALASYLRSAKLLWAYCYRSPECCCLAWRYVYVQGAAVEDAKRSAAALQ